MIFYIPIDAAAVACGADEVVAAIERDAQALAVDIRIVRTGSRGLHWLEPLVEVATENGRIGYGPVTTADIPMLFDALIEGREHPLCIGRPEEHPFLARQTRLTFARCGIIDPASLEDYVAHGGGKGLAVARNLDGGERIDWMKRSGLRGRGGAGFPTGIKWETVRAAQADRKYIVCNADEGDSGTFADRMLMEGDPFCLIEGMAIAGLCVGADYGYCYIRSEYPHAIVAMERAIVAARAAGWLGTAFDMEVRVGAGAYVCGEETALLESIEGKRGQVRAKPPLPAHIGLFGKPTVINNVLSLAAVPFIFSDGPDAYAACGFGRSLGTMPVQIAGNVAHGGLFEAPFGITLRELVMDIGGGTASGRPVRAVQVGGPLGAYFPPDMFDIPFDYESFTAAGGLIGHGGITVFDDSVDMARMARFAFEFCAIESCGKCTPCRIGAVRGVETMDRIIARDDTVRQLAIIEDLAETMKFGSLCALGGFTPYPVTSAIRYFPEDFGAEPALAVAAE